MQLEQIVIIASNLSILCRGRTDAGFSKSVSIAADQLPTSSQKALAELISTATSLLPSDKNDPDLERIAILESELRSLKQKVGLIGIDS